MTDVHSTAANGNREDASPHSASTAQDTPASKPHVNVRILNVDGSVDSSLTFEVRDAPEPDQFSEPQVLRPYHRAEALTAAEAAEVAGKSIRTIREWCAGHDIGRRVQGRWAVSKVALAMLLEDNKPALNAYLAGDRTSPSVTTYFERLDVPLLRQRAA